MITANLRTESYDQFEARCFEMVSKLERKKLKKARTIEESFETDELSQLSSKRRSLANSISKSSYNCYDSASESENSSNWIEDNSVNHKINRNPDQIIIINLKIWIE